MALPVERLLSILTVLVTLRSRVSNWLTARFARRQTPVHDITVGSPVEFDDLTSEFNKREVRQHDHYDRRKATQSQNQKKYVVVGDDSAVGEDVSKDQYNNEALEPLFNQICDSGKGLESLFTVRNDEEAGSSDPKDSHRQTSSDAEAKDTATESVVKPKPAMDDEEAASSDAKDSHRQTSSDAEAKDTATESVVKPKPAMDDEEAASSDAKDSHGQTSSDPESKDTAAESADEPKLSREAEARELYQLYKMPPPAPKNNDQISVTSTDSINSRVRLPWRQWINDIRNKTFSFHWANPFTRHTKSKPMEATMTAVTRETESEESKGNSANVQKKNKSAGKIPLINRFRQLAIAKNPSANQTNGVTKEDQTKKGLCTSNQRVVQDKPVITPTSMYGPAAMRQPRCAWGHDDCHNFHEEKKRFFGLRTSRRSRAHSVDGRLSSGAFFARPVEQTQRMNPRSRANNDPIPTPNKANKGKRLAWFTSRSKKASQQSAMKILNRPVQRNDGQSAAPKG